MILGLMLTMVILALLWDTPTSWLAGWGGGLLPGLAGCSVLLLLARHRGPRLPPWLGGDRAPAPTPEQDPEHEVFRTILSRDQPAAQYWLQRGAKPVASFTAGHGPGISQAPNCLSCARQCNTDAPILALLLNHCDTSTSADAADL